MPFLAPFRNHFGPKIFQRTLGEVCFHDGKQDKQGTRRFGQSPSQLLRDVLGRCERSDTGGLILCGGKDTDTTPCLVPECISYEELDGNIYGNNFGLQ